MRLLAETGEYAGKVLLLLKSVCGLKTSGREFVQKLSEQILSFSIKVKCPKTGEEIEARFTRLAIDPCIYRYEDAMGRIMKKGVARQAQQRTSREWQDDSDSRIQGHMRHQ